MRGRSLAQLLHLPAIASLSTMAVNQHILHQILVSTRENVSQTPMQEYEYLRRCLLLLAILYKRYHVKPPQNLLTVFHNYGDLTLVYTSREFQLDADSFDERHFKFVGSLIASRSQAPAFPFTSALMPKSRPITGPAALMRSATSSSTWRLTNQRPACSQAVADKTFGCLGKVAMLMHTSSRKSYLENDFIFLPQQFSFRESHNDTDTFLPSQMCYKCKDISEKRSQRVQ